MKLLVALLLSISQINAKSSIAVYWGSNDANLSTGELPLSLVEYCKKADVVVISDLWYRVDNVPQLKIAGVNCTTGETNVLHCPGIGEQIKECQKLNTKVLISLRGSYHFGLGDNATLFASFVWNNFFNISSICGERPFNDTILDGIVIHLDLGNGIDGFNNFILKLAEFMKHNNNGKKYYISAAAKNCRGLEFQVIQNMSKMHALDYIGVLQYDSNCQFDPNDPQAFINGWNYWATLNVPIYVGLKVDSSCTKCPDKVKELIHTINHDCKSSSSLFRGVIVRDASLDKKNKKNDGTSYMDCINDVLSSDISPDDNGLITSINYKFYT